ncbi:hypothetical protein Dred_1439 [Desulforamulus reducens MI-1]|uniref:Uncharacterized protein n=1 Tax=Desulforamulus reducens (strain ATCC BAA-1160 / DSM 100696 / MI-1) TaxID=349161 RepID=A4J4G6_DESRM|nr:hypothetical protein [Desulforamulus reducens]ABO49969.1 hypothetical protein Dred_1439 [Desulforamulus reducens MI-1]
MATLAEEIRKKRLIFTLLFVTFTAIYGIFSWQGEIRLTEQQLQYVVLGWRLSLAVLSLWFGYAVGIRKQTTWFVSMLAILPIVSWLGVLYLLFKSGSMLVEAKKGEVVHIGSPGKETRAGKVHQNRKKRKK